MLRYQLARTVRQYHVGAGGCITQRATQLGILLQYRAKSGSAIVDYVFA